MTSDRFRPSVPQVTVMGPSDEAPRNEQEAANDSSPPTSPVPLSRVQASSDEEHEAFPSSALSRLLGGSLRPAPPAAEFHSLHPHVRALTAADVESCVALEEAAFPPEKRCSREKFNYRLSKCGELSLGIFSTAEPSSEVANAATAASATPADSARPQAREVLLAHVVATKSHELLVTDKSMGVPESWPSASTTSNDTGHQELGRTLALHSVAVLPAYQGKGLGSVLVRAYLQRMGDAALADRVVILCLPEKIKWYEKFGFENKGKSEATFGGGGWTAMTYDFPPK
ncbi:MAG: hypothetical protein M1814_003734 [Vezdaea aestivalis]|nr:MAG: hypothetical protein M1814_003734 [Vezdaea aestivalis]